MNGAERDQLIALICKLSYSEWLKLRHAMQMAFDAKISSTSNEIMLDAEAVRRWFDLES
jgi:hypothetical protein